MYRILHIPSGTYMKQEKEDIHYNLAYEVYETPNKRNAQSKIRGYVSKWVDSDLFLDEELTIIRGMETGWYSVLSRIKYVKAEFEIIKV